MGDLADLIAELTADVPEEEWAKLPANLSSQCPGRGAISLADTLADAAYAERNRLVALLAWLYPAGLKRTAIEGWEPEWHGCVYIDLPTGQVSWHYHDRDAHLFEGLPPYEGEWDGHSTEEKYRRVATLGRLARAAWEGAYI